METTFPLGRCVITAGASDVLDASDVQSALDRHARGDWGELDEHDRQENERGLAQGLRLFSRYSAASGKVFYVITEHDRSVTTVLLPEDY